MLAAAALTASDSVEILYYHFVQLVNKFPKGVPGIGVTRAASYEVKRLDSDYFQES